MNELQTTNNSALTYTEITPDLMQRFIDFLDASPKTIETYTRALSQLFKYFSLKGIAQPTRDDIIAFRDELKAGHKPTTVQAYITAARLFFTWTSTEGLYPNIAEHIKGAKLDRNHKKDYLTSAQVKEILTGINTDTITGLRDYAVVALMVTGGLRTIELHRANIEDMRTLGNSTVLFIQGKGREEKTEYIKIQPMVEKAIRAYLKARGNIDPLQPLFTSTSNNSIGRPLTTRSISGTVKTTLRNAGYDSDKLTAHSLRHTAVTLSLLGGNSLQEAQQFARHANIATTLIYSHNLDRAKNNCEETIANAIFG